jgi:arylformamidase
MRHLLQRRAVLAAALVPIVGCARADRRGSASSGGSGAVAENLPYIAGSRAEHHLLDVHHPSPLNPSAKRPVVIYVHGGGWGRGDKRLGNSLAGTYVDRGAVFVSVNYRLAPETRYPGFLEDLAAAVRWVKDNVTRYGGDPDRLFLVGHSAGAHLVALLATDPQFLKRQGLPVDAFRLVVPVDTASFNFLVDPYGMFVNRQKKIREDAFGTDRAIYAAASPTLVAAKARPGSLSPFLIFVGSKREDAVEQSNAFALALRQSGNQGSVVPLDLGHARINQAIGDAGSPLAQALLSRMDLR